MQNSQTTLSQEFNSKNILRPSAEFEKNVRGVTRALISFIIVYIVLSLSGLIVALGMIGLGYLLMASLQAFLIIVLGIGLILSGVMLIFFLVRSIFIKAPAKADRYEVTETEQPELFNFIRQLTAGSGAPFPKHIYIAPEVNASVFFDSSFWSMIFPVRKNLVIGMALVNCTNESEFRAIMEHEFGHFSQRSMRFGSYVYNFNRVIQNTLFENHGYDKMLSAWARWHYLLRLTALLNVKIIQIIQAALRKMYIYINKAHLSLSREMEFHADAIAAYYGGANNMSVALRRIEVGDECYNKVLNILTQKMNDGYCSDNIYLPYLYLLKHFAIENDLLLDNNGLPLIKKDMTVLNNSRIDMKNPWASHPTMAEREARLNEIDIVVEPIEKPASYLFRNINEIQERLTAQMYQNVNTNYLQLKVMNVTAFCNDFDEQYESNSYNKAYKGFYDNRQLTEFDIDEAVSLAGSNPHTTFNSLFNKENCGLQKNITGMQNDIAKLTHIETNRDSDITSFDFDGTNYNKSAAGEIIKIINTQIDAAREKIALLDKDIFIFFYLLAKEKGEQRSLLDQYKQIFNYQQLAKPDYDNYSNLMSDLSPIYSKMKPDAIHDTLSKVYYQERTVKPRIKELMTDDSLIPYITDKKKEILEEYLSKKWVYYEEPSYDNYALNKLNNGLSAYISVINERNFQYKKSVFNFQLSLLDN